MNATCIVIPRIFSLFRRSWPQRFDYNGDGVLDEAEMFVGRRIMAELFLEKHSHDLHLYGNGLSQKVEKNIDDPKNLNRASSGSTHTQQRPAGVGASKIMPYQLVVLYREF